MYEYNPYLNPYLNMYQQQNQQPIQQQMPKQEVVKVNGENGARAYPLGANSSILMLDETQPILWLKVTDGASYPTITPYMISPYKPPEVAQKEELYAGIESRLAKLEEKVFAVAEEKPKKENVK